MKRLCIYLIYDNEGIIDRYIIYMLKQLRKCSTYIMVVCNMEKIKRGRTEVSYYADEIICRSNIGYDAGGFKDALCNYFGWSKVYEYDELILLNDSFFGPFKNMEIIFKDMEKCECDFWGLTKHAYKETEEEIIDEHLQTYFLAIRKPMICCEEFRNYWSNMPYYAHFNEVVSKHEIVFTKYFNRLGYKYECLANMEENDSKNNINNYTQYGFLQYELITKRNFPFLKKKPITYDTLELQTQENLSLSLKYIEENTDYNIDMIWENLIRTVDISDLQRNFHLRFIIPSEINKEFQIEKDIVIAILVRYIDSKEYLLEYISKIRKEFKVEIFSYNWNIIKYFRENGYKSNWLESENKWNQILQYLVKYQYICILHDCDMTSDIEPSCIGKSYFYNGWHNMVASKEYIYYLLEYFEKNKRLGVLAPPIPNFSNFFGKAVREWEKYYNEIEKFIEKNHIHCKISKNKRPFSVSENIWIRGEVLQKAVEYGLLKKTYSRYAWTYIAQELGYYTGIVESDMYASLNEINQEYYINQIIVQINKQCGKVENFLDLQKKIFQCKLSEFCCRFKKIYVYGTGYKAKQYHDMILNLQAYIVSDNQLKKKEMFGKKVLYLSEIKEEDIGIVVCLNEKNQEQVIPLLDRKKVPYLCI